jgi:glutathione S-transferase
MTDLSNLREQIEAAAAAEAVSAEPLTIADIAAAAIVSLETLVAILKPSDALEVMNAYEDRRTAIRNESADTEQAEKQNIVKGEN